MVIHSESLKGLYILLIEDDPTFNQLLSEILDSAGAIVNSTVCFQAARQSLQHIRPHVILCDDRLPDGNSKEFVKQFRAEEDDQDSTLPIIGLSGSALTWREQNQLLQQGFQGYLTKPFEVTQLIQLIQEVTETPEYRAVAPVPRSPASFS